MELGCADGEERVVTDARDSKSSLSIDSSVLAESHEGKGDDEREDGGVDTFSDSESLGIVPKSACCSRVR
jgi:hypothetical protein